MHTPPWLTSLWHWFAGEDPVLRRHVGFCVGSAQLYVLTLAVMWHAVWLGYMPTEVARLITWLMVCTWTLVFALVRSGWSRRFRDPVLTMPHAMAAIFNTVVAYALLGPLRADIFVLLAQSIALTMFRVRPRQSLLLGLWAIGLMGAAQLWLGLWATPVVDPVVLVSHAVVGGVTLWALALVAMWVAELREKIAAQAQRLQDTLGQVQALATTDMLTGLLNRRQIEQVMADEMARAARAGTPLSVAVLDLDHFKRINDLYGHRMGDEVLRRFAGLIKAELRALDHSARWGGEEFLVLMPHVEGDQALVALERIRQKLSELPMSEHESLRVTLSAGLAVWQVGESLEQVIERADLALYEAKHAGRNRVALAAPSPSVPGQAGAASPVWAQRPWPQGGAA
ncbi:GGDEF domain-containing protein [Aquabacterium lacunae]|uniref:diguanylate cyclase n=1 Tax=Aquabacterium lacunae TaxID=2528630 RepID=A0A4Q9H4C6_9BURK|nr:GGDEF domain-containing protein [Aquabacterium lacunae]TBO30341.1 GGDEF domain-containing protein [Aquabacterium lacunae]